MKVLLIDDDQLVRYTLSRVLTGNGYDVTTAVDGKQGLACVAADKPAIVVTDLIMPEQEGIETIIHIRREHPEIRIIAISGGGRDGNLDMLPMAQMLGADAIITKPFEARELLEALQKLASAA
jgi:CheY-like chemotaxis protein